MGMILDIVLWTIIIVVNSHSAWHIFIKPYLAGRRLRKSIVDNLDEITYHRERVWLRDPGHTYIMANLKLPDGLMLSWAVNEDGTAHLLDPAMLGSVGKLTAGLLIWEPLLDEEKTFLHRRKLRAYHKVTKRLAKWLDKATREHFIIQKMGGIEFQDTPN